LKDLENLLPIHFIKLDQPHVIRSESLQHVRGLLQGDSGFGVLFIPDGKALAPQNTWAPVESAVVINQGQKPDVKALGIPRDAIPPLAICDTWPQKSLRHVIYPPSLLGP